VRERACSDRQVEDRIATNGLRSWRKAGRDFRIFRIDWTSQPFDINIRAQSRCIDICSGIDRA
jgi:hypothetical protein